MKALVANVVYFYLVILKIAQKLPLRSNVCVLIGFTVGLNSSRHHKHNHLTEPLKWLLFALSGGYSGKTTHHIRVVVVVATAAIF